jgi:hypothetical protein
MDIGGKDLMSTTKLGTQISWKGHVESWVCLVEVTSNSVLFFDMTRSAGLMTALRTVCTL